MLTKPLRPALRPGATQKWAQPRSARPEASAPRQGWKVVGAVTLVLLHLPLALAMRSLPVVAAVHAMLTVIAGLWICFGKNRMLHLAQWAAYVTGAEALWRMCLAPIPWESAELSICAVCLISLARTRNVQGCRLPLLYLAFLIPGSFIAFVLMPFDDARQQVSFYIAPAAALALCASCFSRLRLTPAALQRIGLAAVAPITGMGLITLFGVTTTDAQFGTSSNFVASGGYGPNQVSAILSLGALLAVFLFLGVNRSLWLRGGILVLGFWLLAQAVLTFSRTGLYLFGASVFVAAPFLVRAKGGSLRFLLLLMVMAASALALFPTLDAFTGGKLTQRYSDRGLTGRDTIAEEELQLWLNEPILGNGVGMSTVIRSDIHHGNAPPAHTEYTRLLAEHGLFGLAALAVLLWMTAQAFLRAPGSWAKGVVAALALWSFLFMAVTSMRLVAPGFLLGLIHAQFQTGAAAAHPRRLRPISWRRPRQTTTGPGPK